MQEEWWRVAIGRLCAVGRIYQQDISYDTIQEIVEGSAVSQAVQEAIFGPLGQLSRYNY